MEARVDQLYCKKKENPMSYLPDGHGDHRTLCSTDNLDTIQKNGKFLKIIFFSFYTFWENIPFHNNSREK